MGAVFTLYLRHHLNVRATSLTRAELPLNVVRAVELRLRARGACRQRPSRLLQRLARIERRRFAQRHPIALRRRWPIRSFAGPALFFSAPSAHACGCASLIPSAQQELPYPGQIHGVAPRVRRGTPYPRGGRRLHVVVTARCFTSYAIGVCPSWVPSNASMDLRLRASLRSLNLSGEKRGGQLGYTAVAASEAVCRPAPSSLRFRTCRRSGFRTERRRRFIGPHYGPEPHSCQAPSATRAGRLVRQRAHNPFQAGSIPAPAIPHVDDQRLHLVISNAWARRQPTTRTRRSGRWLNWHSTVLVRRHLTVRIRRGPPPSPSHARRRGDAAYRLGRLVPKISTARAAEGSTPSVSANFRENAHMARAQKRRHHNTTGERQIRRGRTRRDVTHLARRLKIALASGCPGCIDPNGPTEHAEWCKAWR